MLKKYWKSFAIALIVLILLGMFFGIKNYIIYRQQLQTTDRNNKYLSE